MLTLAQPPLANNHSRNPIPHHPIHPNRPIPPRQAPLRPEMRREERLTKGKRGSTEVRVPEDKHGYTWAFFFVSGRQGGGRFVFACPVGYPGAWVAGAARLVVGRLGYIYMCVW